MFSGALWEWIKVRWSDGHKLDAINLFANHLPDLLYPGLYDASQDHNVLSPIFWWREVFHFFGGMIAGLVFLLVTQLPMPKLVGAILPICVVAIVIGLKEFLGDASEQPNGWDFKNIVDTVAWTLGTASVSLGIYFLRN